MRGGSSLRKGIMRDYVNNKAEGKKKEFKEIDLAWKSQF